MVDHSVESASRIIYPEPWEDTPSHLPRDPIVEDKIARLAHRHDIVCSFDAFDVERTMAFCPLANFQGVNSSRNYSRWVRILRRRGNMDRIAQNLVLAPKLPETQGCAVLQWQPSMLRYEGFFMPVHVRAICDEMDKYDHFLWRDINYCLVHAFKR